MNVHPKSKIIMLGNHGGNVSIDWMANVLT